MPMPMPKKGESRDAFVARCCADEAMQKDYGKGSDQCVAVCESQYERHHQAAAGTPLPVNLKNDVAEVLLYGPVGDDLFGDGVTAKDFRQALKGLKVPTLNLRVNSPGGSVFEASAIMAALDGFKGRIEVDVDGVAASAASVIAMCGDHIRVAPSALVMIHNPHALAAGGAAEMRAMADLLDKSKGQLLDAYERHSRRGRGQLSAWMDAETWFTGREAVDAGLAHAVGPGRAVAACAHFRELAAKLGYRHVPPTLAARDDAAWAATEERRRAAAAL